MYKDCEMSCSQPGLKSLDIKQLQGSNRAAVQCHSQEKVLCLERTGGAGATNSPARATSKQEKSSSAQGSQDHPMSMYCTFRTVHNPGNCRCLEVISEITLWSINVTNKSVRALISALTLIFPGLLTTSQPLEKQTHSFLLNTYRRNSTDLIISSPKIKKCELDAGLITTTQFPGA